MHRLAEFDRIFPITDEASARLAMLKAECLHAAGVISDAEKAAVLARAVAVLENAEALGLPDLRGSPTLAASIVPLATAPPKSGDRLRALITESRRTLV